LDNLIGVWSITDGVTEVQNGVCSFPGSGMAQDSLKGRKIPMDISNQ